jgi:hypothetical protein
LSVDQDPLVRRNSIHLRRVFSTVSKNLLKCKPVFTIRNGTESKTPLVWGDASVQRPTRTAVRAYVELDFVQLASLNGFDAEIESERP